MKNKLKDLLNTNATGLFDVSSTKQMLDFKSLKKLIYFAKNLLGWIDLM
jgi:hypothetical protein